MVDCCYMILGLTLEVKMLPVNSYAVAIFIKY